MVCTNDQTKDGDLVLPTPHVEEVSLTASLNLGRFHYGKYTNADRGDQLLHLLTGSTLHKSHVVPILAIHVLCGMPRPSQVSEPLGPQNNWAWLTFLPDRVGPSVF
jgi:hypothetical protein